MSVAILLEHSRTLSQEESTPNIEEVAAVALRLAALHSEIAEHLEPLKEYLRTEARKDRSHDTNKVVVEGVLPALHPLLSPNGPASVGEVQITYPDASLKIPKGVDEKYLREQLGADLFDDAFQVVKTVRLRKDLKTRLRTRTASAGQVPEGGAGSPPGSLERVLQYLDMVEPTPRVGFRPVPGILSEDL